MTDIVVRIEAVARAARRENGDALATALQQPGRDLQHQHIAQPAGLAGLGCAPATLIRAGQFVQQCQLVVRGQLCKHRLHKFGVRLWRYRVGPACVAARLCAGMRVGSCDGRWPMSAEKAWMDSASFRSSSLPDAPSAAAISRQAA